MISEPENVIWETKKEGTEVFGNSKEEGHHKWKVQKYVFKTVLLLLLKLKHQFF